MNLTKRVLLLQYKEDFIVFVKQLIAKGMKLKYIASLTGLKDRMVGRLAAEDEKNYLLTPDKITLIVEFMKSGMTPTAVAKELGITVYHVHDALKTEIITRYLQLTSIRQMKNDLSISNEKISKVLSDAGIIIPKGHGAYNHYGDGTFPLFKPISSYLKDVIIGELLGDGHIREIKHETGKYSLDTPSIPLHEYKNALDALKELTESKTIENLKTAIEKFNKSMEALQNAKATHFELALKMSTSKWVRFVGGQFTESGYGTSYYHAKRSNVEIYGANREDNLMLRTENSVQLQKIREEWYEKQENGKNIKIIPENYGGLNANRILSWYAGDGSYSGNEVSFATDSFREEDVHRLSEDLNKAAGIHSYVNKTSKTNEEGEDQWKIRFGARADVEKFFKYLEHANKDALRIAKEVFPQKFPVE